MDAGFRIKILRNQRDPSRFASARQREPAWGAAIGAIRDESTTLFDHVINHAFRKTAIPKMQNIDPGFGPAEYENKTRTLWFPGDGGGSEDLDLEGQ